jgi:hypothetical protein
LPIQFFTLIHPFNLNTLEHTFVPDYLMLIYIERYGQKVKDLPFAEGGFTSNCNKHKDMVEQFVVRIKAANTIIYARLSLQ